MKQLTHLNSWQKLEIHRRQIENISIQELFANNPNRFKQFSMYQEGLLLDYSKNRVTSETQELLTTLAREANLPEKINALFAGKPVNSTEKRAALHTALRDSETKNLFVNGHDVMPDIKQALAKMREFTEKVRNQTWLGVTEKPIKHILNIGVGGSHFGPFMSTHALTDFLTPQLSCQFLSNIDNAHVNEVLRNLDAETTLFIVSSKSFTTPETLMNAHTIKSWLCEKLGTDNLSAHFVAVTANALLAEKFGIPNSQIFPIWDWVGGRYSIWSTIALPLALMIGMDNFTEFLQGGYEMDQHFRTADFSENMPVMLGLLGIWYINFFGATNHAIIPYSHRLNYFRQYIQQADMESNGKMKTHQGETTNYATAPVIFGEQGCDGQHAFHQLLHQGTRIIPVDFILVGQGSTYSPHQDMLIASGLSQAQALMQGKSYDEALQELIDNNFPNDEAIHLAKHKTIPGNRPSNILFLDKITPKNLGKLIALYEHKIYVQAAIWDINSFDQWGIELGKQLLPNILANLQNAVTNPNCDSSTAGLTEHYVKLKSTYSTV